MCEQQNYHRDLLEEYKRHCRYKQLEFWQIEMERINNDEGNMWEIWKTLGENTSQPQHINVDGNAWEKYFIDLYNHRYPSQNLWQDRLETPNQPLNKIFTICELKNAIKNLKNKKAVGYDSISNELLKLSTVNILNIILKFMNLCLKLSLIPPVWCLSLINPIHKQGSKSNPENYRGISIMNALLKVLIVMMNNRLNEYCENNNIINRGQLGFRKHNRTVDQVTTLKSLVNKYTYDKKRNFTHALWILKRLLTPFGMKVCSLNSVIIT